MPKNNLATCKTCGGSPNNHRPSPLDPNGIGDPGHKMTQPPTTGNQDEKWKTIADFGDGVDLDELLKALDTQASELDEILDEHAVTYARTTKRFITGELTEVQRDVLWREQDLASRAAIEALLVEARIQELQKCKRYYGHPTNHAITLRIKRLEALRNQTNKESK